MKVKLCVASLCLLVLSSTALADSIYDLNLPGIGLIPVESYSINNQTLSVTRTIDAFSPAIFDATVTGTTFATGSLEIFDTSVSLTTPVSSFVMTDIIFTSIQYLGSPLDPLEVDTMAFATGTTVANTPEPSSLALVGCGLVALVGRRRRARS